MPLSEQQIQRLTRTAIKEQKSGRISASTADSIIGAWREGLVGEAFINQLYRNRPMTRVGMLSARPRR
jgi:hypothetical protein